MLQREKVGESGDVIFVIREGGWVGGIFLFCFVKEKKAPFSLEENLRKRKVIMYTSFEVALL
jgi:hypothetical protein